MSLEFDIPMKDSLFLRVRRRRMGDIEMRIWKKVDGSAESLPAGLFLPFQIIDLLVEVLRKIQEENLKGET